MSKPKTKKKVHGLDLYVIFSISALIVYTITSQILAVRTMMTMDTLTTCFFAFFGGEIVTCALIKIFKLKDEKKEDKTDTNQSQQTDDDQLEGQLTFLPEFENNTSGKG